MFLIVLLALLAIGIAVGAYAIFAPRRPAVAVEAASTPVAASRSSAASEAERVDAVFAMGALDGDEATRRLTEALDDPSETVALAAAHALATSGRQGMLRAYVDAHPSERTTRIAETIDWMHTN